MRLWLGLGVELYIVFIAHLLPPNKTCKQLYGNRKLTGKEIMYDNVLFVKSAFSNYTFYLYPGLNFDF